MGNINEFPVDDHLKELIANMIRNKLEQMGIYMEDNGAKLLKETFAEQIVNEVLEGIIQWQKIKLQ